MSWFDSLGKFATSPEGIGLLALSGGALAAPALAGAAGTGAAGAGGMGLLGATGAEAAGAGAGSALGGLAAGNQVNLANSALLMNGAANPALAGAAANPGLLHSANAALKEYQPLIGAVGIGMNAAQMGQSPQQPIQPPMVQPAQGGSQTLASLASAQKQGIQDELANSAQERMQRKMMRRGLL